MVEWNLWELVFNLGFSLLSTSNEGIFFSVQKQIQYISPETDTHSSANTMGKLWAGAGQCFQWANDKRLSSTSCEHVRSKENEILFKTDLHFEQCNKAPVSHNESTEYLLLFCSSFVAVWSSPVCGLSGYRLGGVSPSLRHFKLQSHTRPLMSAMKKRSKGEGPVWSGRSPAACQVAFVLESTPQPSHRLLSTRCSLLRRGTSFACCPARGSKREKDSKEERGSCLLAS